MLIRDIRGSEPDYTLDTHGFQVYTLPKNERNISDMEVVKTEYYDEVAASIKEMFV
jgi:hypothetical protein